MQLPKNVIQVVRVQVSQLSTMNNSSFSFTRIDFRNRNIEALSNIFYSFVSCKIKYSHMKHEDKNESNSKQ